MIAVRLMTVVLAMLLCASKSSSLLRMGTNKVLKSALSVDKGSRTSAIGDYNCATHLNMWDIDNFTEEFEVCEFLGHLVEFWDEGCFSIVDQIKAISWATDYVFCLEVGRCMSDADVPNVLHGTCYTACENVRDESEGLVSLETQIRKTKTKCSQSTIMAAGMQDVCENLPQSSKLMWDSWSGILMTSSFLYLQLAIDYITHHIHTRLHGERHAMGFAGIVDAFEIISTAVLLCHVLATALNTVSGNIGHLCRYLSLATPMLFTPYYRPLTRLALLCSKIGKMLLFDDLDKISVSQRCVCVLCLFCCCLGVLVGLILFIMGVLILVTVAVAALWAPVAYIHIVLLFAAYLVCVAVSLACLHCCWVYCSGNDELQLQDEKLKFGRLVQEGFLGFFIVTLSSATSFLAMLFIAGFLLYVHGDWHRFHDAIFSLPHFTFPRISIALDMSLFFEMFRLTFDFDLSLPPFVLNDVSLTISLLCSSLKVLNLKISAVWKGLKKAINKTGESSGGTGEEGHTGQVC